MNKVPKGWQFRALGDVCELVSGQHINAKDYNVEQNGIGYLTGPADFSEIYPIVSKWTEHPKRTARRNDILITVKGSGVGKINLMFEDELAISRQLMAVRSKNVNINFLYSFLQLQFSYFQSLANGAAIPGISRSDVLSIKIPLPDQYEQKRIVAILDEVFAGITQAIANAEKNLANARELFESYLNSVFSKKGTEWKPRSLGKVCDNLDSKRIPITKAKRMSGNIPYYGASGVVDHVAEYIFDEDLLLVSEDGANLLARTYPIAFSISGKSWVNNHAHVLRFKEISSQRFIEYYLNSISLEPYVSGMAQPKLNQKLLNSIPVPFPNLIEQELVVKNLDELSSETRHLETIYQKKLSALAELKQSILQKAFTGELTADTVNQQLVN